MTTTALTSIEPSSGITENLRKKLPTIIIGSLSLVVGLSWNNAFQALIDQYTPDKYKNDNNAWIKIVYSTILTIIIVFVISIILHFPS